MQETVLKIRYFENDYQKILKKLTWFFLLPSAPFYGQDYEKQFELKNMFRKIPLLVIYYLGNFDDLIQSDFLVVPKITFANLCKAHSQHNYFSFVWPFEFGKCENEGKKLRKIEYLDNKKSFLDEIKSIFHNFWNAFFL